MYAGAVRALAMQASMSCFCICRHTTGQDTPQATVVGTLMIIVDTLKHCCRAPSSSARYFAHRGILLMR